MNRSISDQARPIVQELEAYFHQAQVFLALKERGAVLFAQISAKEPYAVAVISLATLPEDIPETVGSIRVAVFFPNVQTKIERHPNSQQFLWSLSGQGETQVYRNDRWEQDAYGEGIENDVLEAHWHLVEANTWHRSIGTGTAPWLLVAIHTAKEVVDEYWE